MVKDADSLELGYAKEMVLYANFGRRMQMP